jgi:hypothetical protein
VYGALGVTRLNFAFQDLVKNLFVNVRFCGNVLNALNIRMIFGGLNWNLIKISRNGKGVWSLAGRTRMNEHSHPIGL